MDVINENEKIDLILSASVLNKSNDIRYNSKNKNVLLINNFFLEYNSIKLDNDPKNNNYLLLIINHLLNKNDATIIILTDSNKDSNIYLTSLQKVLNRDIYKEYNIKSIDYIYSYINEKNKNYHINDLSEIRNIDNNISIKIKIENNNDIIYTCFKILILNNSFEKICPLFCLNRKDYELIILKEKISKLLASEKKFEKNIKNLPLLNIDLIENINSYKNETFDYFSKFMNDVEKLNNKFNNIKSVTKNDLNDFIKELNSFFNKINKEKYLNKQNDIYKQYIETYKSSSNIDTIKQNEDNLKSLFLKFTNTNEEIINFLESNDINKKEIMNLKNIIKFLQNELKQEKSRNISKIQNNINENYNQKNSIDNNTYRNNQNTSNIKRNSKQKSFNKSFNMHKSLSAKRYHRIHKRNVSMDSSSYNYNKSFEGNKHNENDIKYLNKKINQLNDIISNLKSNNEILEKSNEKMKKDIKNLNKIISKLERNNEENNLIANNSIKSLKPKILEANYKKQFFWQKIQNNSNLRLNNDKDTINGKDIPGKKATKINNNSSMDDEHYILLKKIQDENKKMAKIINNYYCNNTEFNSSSNNLNINKTNNELMINNSTSKKVKNKKNLYNKLHLNIYSEKNVNKKSSAPKIRILKFKNHK